jgi:hypothetical protein
MHCSKIKTGKTHLFLIPALVCILLSGCAGQRWAEPLPEEEQNMVTQTITAMQKATRECPNSFDADALIFWKSPLDDWAVEGYIQMLSPSFTKFIISNPLGQLIYAFASNGSDFQILQTRQYQHIRGSIRSLAFRKEVPQILVTGDWFAYLTGQLPAAAIEVVEVNRDASDTSIWLRIVPAESEMTLESAWVHLDPLQKTVLGYLFLDSTGETLAEIIYANQQEEDNTCTPEDEITITKLPWGAQLTIQLKNINGSNQFNEKDFSLPVPPGYTTQLQP